MKLSIITINYNDKEGLRKTIQSVLSQTFTDYEYLIIDGGSTDGSLDVIKEYEDKITYWISEKDNGIYNAMNKGIVKSKGEYLQFLNSGDYLVNDAVFENMIAGLPECDMAYGNCVLVFPDGKTKTEYPNESGITFETFFRATINHQSAFFNRKLFDKYGLYDEQLKLASDWKFFFIAFGMNESHTVYRNFDMVFYDMSGISIGGQHIWEAEKQSILKAMVPQPILAEYKKNQPDVAMFRLIRKYKLTFKLYRLFQMSIIRIAKVLDVLNRK